MAYQGILTSQNVCKCAEKVDWSSLCGYWREIFQDLRVPLTISFMLAWVPLKVSLFAEGAKKVDCNPCKARRSLLTKQTL